MFVIDITPLWGKLEQMWKNSWSKALFKNTIVNFMHSRIEITEG